MASKLTKEQWNAVLHCSPDKPITAKRACAATPYVYRDARDRRIEQSLVQKLVDGGVVKGKVAQPGLSPDLHFHLTPLGEAWRVEATQAFEKTKR